MISFKITSDIRKHLPDVRLGIVYCKASPEPSSPSLLQTIQNTLETIAEEHNRGSVSQIPTVFQTKSAYRLLGKDPSRYRPSAEALLRRVVKGQGLYQINNLVDVLNLISIKTGFSIGGYDTSKIEGTVYLGVGQPEEPYEAIGRGSLNIECLPLLRDESGPFGSPTSDSQRTMVTEHCKQFTMVFFDFQADHSLSEALELTKKWLPEYTNATEITSTIIT